MLKVIFEKLMFAFQIYEWLSIERVISNEVGLDVNKILKTYKDQNLVKNKFNKNEKRIRVLILVFTLMCTVGYLYLKAS